MKKSMSGGHAVAEMVVRHGSEGPIFGMGGFQMLPFYEAARELGLRHVLINDERAGAFAADAYARMTGRPGLCDGTLGPGATNLVTALAESYNAGVPIIALVGDTHRAHSWKNMTQEARQAEILAPVCKEYLRVEEIARIPELVRRAFGTATSGRPGPVVLCMPEDIAHDVHDFDESELWVDENVASVPARRSRPSRHGVEAAADLLAQARRPIVLAGGGVHLSEAWQALAELAEALDAPVAHTLSGKGAIACTDRRSVGLFGRYSRYANELIDEADAILAVGCKFGEIATKRYTLPRPEIPVVHLDVLAEEIGRHHPVHTGLVGDAREGLLDLAEAIRCRGIAGRDELWNDVARLRDEWLDEARPKYESEESPVHMARLLAELGRTLRNDAVVVADGGFASHWTGLLHDTRAAGRGFVPNRGFASIGYGLPGAMGCAMGRPGVPVVGITGDGGFNMVVGELETAVRLGLEFVLVIVNNAASGYVKALQHAVYGEGHYESSDLSDLDYARVAEAYGCRGIRVDRPVQLADALRSAIAERGRPTVVDVAVTRDPARMLPAVDSRTLTVEAGDRPA